MGFHCSVYYSIGLHVDLLGHLHAFGNRLHSFKSTLAAISISKYILCERGYMSSALHRTGNLSQFYLNADSLLLDNTRCETSYYNVNTTGLVCSTERKQQGLSLCMLDIYMYSSQIYQVFTFTMPNI